MLVAACTVAALAGALLGWSGWRAVRDRPVVLRQLLLAGVVVLALLAQAGVGVVGLLRGHEPGDGVLFWGYLVTAVLLLPVGGGWAFADRTRWSSVVLAVAAFSVVIMEVRMWQVWA